MAFFTFLTSICLAVSTLALNQESLGQIAELVGQIMQSDYAGERAALQREYDALERFLPDEKFRARIHYWRGYARWRMAINGFNDNIDQKELEADLKQALVEFNEVSKDQSGYIEARIGAISCLGNLMFIHRSNATMIQELVRQVGPIAQEAKDAAPGNPRRLWVMGPIIWNAPPERGGGEEKAILAYEKGLALIHADKKTSADVLEPTWGEPELLMSLAWSYSNRNKPDLKAAELNARRALQLVPNWHYVRDILLPQIEERTDYKPVDS
jgi:hypothetical protein